ncbi:hypothetical protein ACFL4Y_02515 [Gemmatimonadota bacterium]
MLLLASACSGGGDWAGRIETVEGVTHLYNPETPLWEDDGPEFIEREQFGGAGVPAEQLMTEPVTVVVAADGTRLLLDTRQARILRYAPDGAYLGSFGRLGNGPGEFMWPTDMALLPDGTLAVADSKALRLSLFSAEGSFLGSNRPEVGPGQIKALSTGALLAYSQPRQLIASLVLKPAPDKAAPDEEPTLLDILDTYGERHGGLGRITEYEGLMLGAWMNRVYPAVTSGDSVVVNYLALDRMEVYTPSGQLARVVHRHLPWEPIEPFEESAAAPKGGVSTRFEFDILSTGLAVSPDGSMWAVAIPVTPPARRMLENEADEERMEVERVWAIDLHDASGRWLMRHELGTGFEMPFLDWWQDGLYLCNPEGDATVRRLELMGGW